MESQLSLSIVRVFLVSEGFNILELIRLVTGKGINWVRHHVNRACQLGKQLSSN